MRDVLKIDSVKRKRSSNPSFETSSEINKRLRPTKKASLRPTQCKKVLEGN